MIIFILKKKFIHIKKEFNLYRHQYLWKKKNTHNFTEASNVFDTNKVSVGDATYGNLKVIMYGNPSEKLEIGNFCSISDNVEFLLGGEHHPYLLFNYPFLINLVKNDSSYKDNTSKGPIIIGDDVWFGRNAIILSGVKIGNGAIIAAGSVITKDIPEYSIATTNKIIKTRFSSEIIKELNNMDYSSLSNKNIESIIDLIYKEKITKDQIKKVFNEVE